MSEINQTEVVEETTITGTEVTAEAGIKTFTQDEVNTLIESRLARIKKQIPAKEELEAFQQWKDSQKTDAERIAQREQEFHKLESDKEAIKRENTVLRAGVSHEDIDYVLFKVSKLEGDFDENLKQFLDDNPRHLNQSNNTVKNTGVITKPQMSNQVEDKAIGILMNKYPKILKNSE